MKESIKNEAKVRDRKPLTVRVAADVADWLNNFSRPGRSQAYIVEQALKHLKEQEPPVQDDILKGRLDFFELAGRIIEGEAWADHAFKRGWPAWAIELYSYIAKQSDLMPGIKRLTWYKLGSSWLNFAMEIRREVLRTQSPDRFTWEKYYLAAIESLQFSVAYHRLMNNAPPSSTDVGLSPRKHDGPKNSNGAVLYNLACSWALIAQYAIEKSDGPSGTLVRKARERVKQAVDPFHQEHDWMPGAGEKLDDKLTSALKDRVAKRALRETLETLKSIPAGSIRKSTDIPMEVTYWLFDYAEVDPDFALVRRTEQDFHKIVKTKRAAEGILSAFEKLKKSVPDEITPFIPRLEGPALEEVGQQ